MQIFRRPYTVRRFSEQQIVRGHAASSFIDSVTKLNVQPFSPNDLQSLPEGQRTVKRVKAFGDYALRAANQEDGTPGDWLYYLGQWYQCTSSVRWDHTLLGHYRSDFAVVAETQYDTSPPVEAVIP